MYHDGGIRPPARLNSKVFLISGIIHAALLIRSLLTGYICSSDINGILYPK
ncbi:hypothetical protein DDI_1139 [Dickeya dianthicola RNS04.9]|nr:hypothetical protein DDI_1139 [Dickeya dianthicola RNS04.9]